jgi:hypothetical protein
MWEKSAGCDNSAKSPERVLHNETNCQCGVNGCTKWTDWSLLPSNATHQPLLNQLIAIPLVFIADKAEVMINDATAGGGGISVWIEVIIWQFE